MHAIQPQVDQLQSDLVLNGDVGYSISGDRILVNIGCIANNRNALGVSGTLSVELWALKQSYQGGFFQGMALAGTEIGELMDQHQLADCRYDLLFREPPVGVWYMTLMLREWTPDGYVTRHFVNFTHPYVVNWKPTLVHGTGAKVIPFKEEQPAVSAEIEMPVSLDISADRNAVESSSLESSNQEDSLATSEAHQDLEALDESQKPVQDSDKSVTLEQADATVAESDTVAESETVAESTRDSLTTDEATIEDTTTEVAAIQDAATLDATVEVAAAQDATNEVAAAQDATNEVAAAADETIEVVTIEDATNELATGEDATNEVATIEVATKAGVQQGSVSINHGTLQEIASLKGVSKRLAGSIVAGRPYDSLEELLSIKGIGEKLLKKLRNLIRL